VELHGAMTIKAIISRIILVTGLNIEVSQGLADHDPDLGIIQPRKLPAWMVMSLVMEREVKDGQWEKTSNGYRLVGSSLAVPREKPPELGVLFATLIFLLVACTALGYALLRRHKQRAVSAPPTTPSQSEP
jgi:hypothetical protein